MRDHDGPKTLSNELTIRSPVPSVVYVTKGKALESGDWHFESTILDHLTPDGRDRLPEISLDRHTPRTDDDHHEDQLTGRFVELECTAVNEGKTRCNVGPV